MNVVRSSIPSLAPHLARVHHGYGIFGTYRGLFRQEGVQWIIIINLCLFKTNPLGGSRFEHTLLHRFVITIAQENGSCARAEKTDRNSLVQYSREHALESYGELLFVG